MKKTLIIIAVAVVLFVLTGYFIKKYNAKYNAKHDSETGNETGNKNSIFPLKLGSQGPEVESLQRLLNKPSSYGPGLDEIPFLDSLPENGIYDTQTDAAIKQFLKVNQVSQELYNQLISNK